MRGAVVLCALGLFVFAALVPAKQKAEAYTIGLCYAQSFDQKTGSDPPNNFFWIAAINCSPGIVDVMWDLTELYWHNWDDHSWYPISPLGSNAALDTYFLADSGFGNAPGYLGAGCYSAFTYWGNWTAPYPPQSGRSASPGRRY